MKTNQIILPSLVLVLCLAAGALTLALIQTRRSLARANRVLDSIPLRSDQRKQSVGKTEAEMHHVSFYDDSTLLFTSGNTIYLQPEDVYNSGKGSQWPELQVPTLIHELRHKWQFERNKLLYILCCILIVREFTIERDAEKITKKAYDFCEEMDWAEAIAEYERKEEQKKREKK